MTAPRATARVGLRTASKRDLLGIGRVHLRAFPDTLAQLHSPRLSPLALADIMRACLEAEPGCISVAEAQPDGGIVGYIIAAAEVGRVARAALARGLVFIWLWRWLSGRYRISKRGVRHILGGKVSFWQAGGEPGASCPRILSLAVEPAWRRHGIGGRLLALAISRLRARGCECVRLEVRPENETALGLYQRFGFRVVGRFEDSRGPWEVMTLQLRASRPADA